MGLLHTWEFEWFKAFHLLRDGQQAPTSLDRETLDPEYADAAIQELREMPLREIVGQEPPAADYEPTKLGDRPGLHMWTFWAEGIKEKHIQIVRSMKPREVHARTERREIWQSLWQARSRKALLDACHRWGKLEDVIGLGFGAFPAHVEANATEFLAMTKSKRFPKSRAADDSRMLHLARGMAGVMADVSPMTGIERLRNMKHRRGGPFWSEREKRCGCWRCVGRDVEGWKI